MRVIDLLTAVPGGWRYQEARTGFWAVGITFHSMVNSAAMHRANMKFPIVTPPFETLAAEIQDWMCQHMSEKNRERLCAKANVALIGPRPGDLFSRVIHKITGRYALTCGRCMNRMGMMNSGGWIWCWRNRNTIIGWITEEAQGRGHKIDERTALSLFRAAFKEIHAARAKTPKTLPASST